MNENITTKETYLNLKIESGDIKCRDQRFTPVIDSLCDENSEHAIAGQVQCDNGCLEMLWHEDGKASRPKSVLLDEDARSFANLHDSSFDLIGLDHVVRQNNTAIL